MDRSTMTPKWKSVLLTTPTPDTTYWVRLSIEPYAPVQAIWREADPFYWAALTPWGGDASPMPWWLGIMYREL